MTDDRKKGPKLQFEVNGRNYFLNFVPDKGRWFLFEPTRRGIRAIPVVYDDEPHLIGPDEIELDEPDTEIVN